MSGNKNNWAGEAINKIKNEIENDGGQIKSIIHLNEISIKIVSLTKNGQYRFDNISQNSSCSYYLNNKLGLTVYNQLLESDKKSDWDSLLS